MSQRWRVAALGSAQRAGPAASASCGCVPLGVRGLCWCPGFPAHFIITAAQREKDAVLFYLHGVCGSGTRSHLPVFLQAQEVGPACLDPASKHAVTFPHLTVLCALPAVFGAGRAGEQNERLSVCLNVGKLSSVFVIEQT